MTYDCHCFYDDMHFEITNWSQLSNNDNQATSYYKWKRFIKLWAEIRIKCAFSFRVIGIYVFMIYESLTLTNTENRKEMLWLV